LVDGRRTAEQRRRRTVNSVQTWEKGAKKSPDRWSGAEEKKSKRKTKKEKGKTGRRERSLKDERNSAMGLAKLRRDTGSASCWKGGGKRPMAKKKEEAAPPKFASQKKTGKRIRGETNVSREGGEGGEKGSSLRNKEVVGPRKDRENGQKKKGTRQTMAGAF